MAFNTTEPTPCGVLFDLMKRRAGLSHKALAELILSSKPLSDGKSPVNRVTERSWLSQFVVHAPVSSLKPDYFCDWGTAAVRVMDRLRSRPRRKMGGDRVLDLVCGEDGRTMDQALAAVHQNVRLYRNAVERLAEDDASGHTPGERAEVALVLLIAVGCSANVPESIEYARTYAQESLSLRMSTPTSAAVAAARVERVVEAPRPLGLIRVKEGYVAGDPHWIAPDGSGITIGALATGELDISDVEPDVSGEHARIWCDPGASDDGKDRLGDASVAAPAGQGRWLVEDLGSTNGTQIMNGASHVRRRLDAGRVMELHPGDELTLGGTTTFAVIEGAV